MPGLYSEPKLDVNLLSSNLIIQLPVSFRYKISPFTLLSKVRNSFSFSLWFDCNSTSHLFSSISLIIRPAIYVFSVGMHKDSSSGIITQSFAEKVEASLVKEVPSLPEVLVKSAVRSNLSFVDHKYIQATSRITSIINSLARSVKTDMKVDRGASTPEKSWFSIARRNYKYFGWDIKMLDELYRFAAENNW